MFRKIIGWMMLAFAGLILFAAVASKVGAEDDAYTILLSAVFSAFIIKTVDLTC